jgi:hypothetical protein
MSFYLTAEHPDMIRLHVTIAASFLFVVSAARAADFTVINTDDSGPGSLRQAIVDANANPGTDRILFNIPGSGVHKIVIGGPTNPNFTDRGTALPEITDPVTIDGYSQPGSHPNTLLNGDNAVILIQISKDPRRARLLCRHRSPYYRWEFDGARIVADRIFRFPGTPSDSERRD